MISEDQPWVRQLPAPAHVPGPRWLLRLVVVAVLVAGGLYLGWRYLYSFNADYWPFAAALLGAETFSYLNTWLFGVGMWRLRERPPPPPPLEGTTVDVFITCYREPVDIVRETVVAARDIRWPHRTYVLDDGGSPAMAAMAEEVGVDYIARSSEWEGKPRHAKAGNLNNALMRTDGEIILMLDADQIPWPDILHRTLGWFNDPKMAAVQTHQWFYNVPDGDPMGSHAYLFYGPIQQAKDGWDAAFFCGSCGLLRREALMQTGIRTYVHDLDRRVREALATADRVLRRARRQLGRAERGEPKSRADALDDLRTAVAAARSRLAHGDSVQEVTWEVQRSATDVSRRFVEDDIEGIRRDLRATPGLEDGTVETALTAVVDDDTSMRQLAGTDVGPLTAIATVHDLLMEVDVVRADEAQPVMPMSTMAVTEDLATAMALHSTGWDSCYHDEVLARGLAPLELRAALTQRLRWAEGTMQMLLRQNPLRVKGLSTGQRLMYMATMLSYLSGFASVVYLSAPPLYIFAGVMPVRAYSWELLAWLAPYLLLNAVLFALVGWRRHTWRGQQYALVLFPVWIRSVFHAVAEVWFGRRLEFATTPKTLESRGLDLRPVAVQLATIGVLVVAGAYGISSLLLGERDDTLAVSLNGLWIVYDLVMLSVVIKAVTFRPSDADLTRTAAAIWRDADDVPGRIGAGRR